jgi:hypothetical protein
MGATDAAGWRVPCDAVHYAVLGLGVTVMVGALNTLEAPGADGRWSAWTWALVVAVALTFGTWRADRPIRDAIRGRSDAERTAVRQALRTGVLPPDGSFDEYVGWTIQVVRRTWRITRRTQPWVAVLLAAVGLVVAVATGQPLWLVFAMVSAGLAAILRWDLARMDACFAGLERQIAARLTP